jgi:hypothetical protein
VIERNDAGWVTSALQTSWESLAVNRRTWVSGELNVTVVESAPGAENVTAAGPEAMLHEWVRTPEGLPSSAAVPVRLAVAGSVTVWLGRAVTTGG